MNHRISEIADSVGLGIKHNGIVLIKNVDAATAFEKFAELIVRECIASIPSTGHRGDFYRAVEFCQLEIKKHFGVES